MRRADSRRLGAGNEAGNRAGSFALGGEAKTPAFSPDSEKGPNPTRAAFRCFFSSLVTSLVPAISAALKQSLNPGAEPGRNLRPHPPQDAKRNCKQRELDDHFGMTQHGNEADEEHSDRGDPKQSSRNDGDQNLKDRRPPGDLRLRGGKIAAAALGAGFRRSGITMASRAQLHVERTAARIAVQRFARRNASAIEAEFHRSSVQALVVICSRPLPDRRPESLLCDCTGCREPEDPVGEFRCHLT